MSRVESLPNRAKPRTNHRAGVHSPSHARSSSYLGAYKVFMFAQIPSHRILQRLLQRPHGRLFQVCAADDVREQSRDLALRVRHRVVFVRVHGARAGVTPARRWVSADCEFFVFEPRNHAVGRRARTVCAHDGRRAILKNAETNERRLEDSRTTKRETSGARFASDDGETDANERRCARWRDAWHNAFDILYKNGRASNAAPRRDEGANAKRRRLRLRRGTSAA